jgi:hypothetical protein
MMDLNSPAIGIKSADLAANTEALKSLLKESPNDFAPNRILDIRYGLGGWARCALGVFPRARLIGYEADSETARRAWKSERVQLRRKRFGGTDTEGADLVLADFNVTTQLNRGQVDSLIELGARWIVFTDTACAYLHLNYERYGLDRPNLDDYWRQWDVGGYTLVAYAKKHRTASTGLFQYR